MRRWVVPKGSGALSAVLAVGVVGVLAVAGRWPLEQWRQWLPDLLVGWAFLGSGALIARRPGGRREGFLVGAVGAAWFLADVVPEAVLLHRAVLIHATVAMPRGRVPSTLGRAVVVAGYASVLLASMVSSPLIALVLAVGVLAVARTAPGSRRGSCIALGALLAAVAVAQFVAAQAAAVLLMYESGLVAVAIVLVVESVRASDRAEVTDLVVEMGPRDALADLVRRDPTVREDPALRAAVAAADRLRAANAQLTGDLETQIEAVDASRRRVLAAQDAERVALEDRLRHGPAGRLDRVAADLAGQASNLPEATDRLAAARDQVAEARADLARIAAGLYPAAIADGSLESALNAIAASSPIPVDLDLAVTRVGPDAAAVAFFVCSEAVANAARHSGGTRVTIRLEARRAEAGAEVVIEVSDDGVGGADLDRGSGLRGLADRVGIAGGELTVHSGPWGARIGAGAPDGSGSVTAGG